MSSRRRVSGVKSNLTTGVSYDDFIPHIRDLDPVGNEQAIVQRRRGVPTNALTPNDDGSMQFKQFTLTPIGIVPVNATDDELNELGQILGKLDQSLQWLIGDWANFYADDWGKKYQTLSEITGLDQRTLATYATVCRAVQLSIRIDNLTFSHHRLVVSLGQEEQSHWLNMAVQNGWSVSQMKKAMLDTKNVQTKDHNFVDDVIGELQKSSKAWRKAEPTDRIQIAEFLRNLADTLEN